MSLKLSVQGTVRTPEGFPIEGVLVMGADLNYAETGPDGRFTLQRPEMALFFWCSGFLPKVRPLTDGAGSVDVVLQRAMRARARAAGA